MRDIIRRQKLPGGSLSLAKEGRLVYARGFGWAEVQERVPARPATMFGLASVSKAITAVAILKLVDQGRLGLDDRAFEILRDITPLPGQHVDPRTRAITIRQLLNHSAGYKQQPDEAEVSRHMGIPLPKLREDHLIKFFLGHRLDFAPGTEQEYSNFGFVVLGAVVERIVGLAYGPAVHRLVFNAMGVRQARLGHGGPKQPGTARPYDEAGKGLPPIDIAGESAGGWIVSTIELIRFLTAIDGVRGRPFLSRNAVREMLGPPTPPLKKRGNGTWYGLGWDVVRETPQGPSYMKNGGMSGVRAAMGRLPGKVDWAVAFNGGRDVRGQIDVDAEATGRIGDAVGQTTDWPEVDQFPSFA